MNSSLTFENFQANFCDPLVFGSTASSCTVLNIPDSEMLAIEFTFEKSFVSCLFVSRPKNYASLTKTVSPVILARLTCGKSIEEFTPIVLFCLDYPLFPP